MPKFRAQKVSKRGSVVRRRRRAAVQRPPPTQFAEFNLSGIGSMAKRRPSDAGLSSTSVTSVSSRPARPSFKARPMPAYKASGLKAQTPRQMTRPQSPKFVTSQRAATRPPPAAPTEASHIQGAAGAVVGVKSSRASVGAFAEPRPVTTPRPFNLSGVERHDMAKAARERQLADEAAAAEKARSRGAQGAEGGGVEAEPSKAAPLVEAKPFNLSTNERGDFFKAEERARRPQLPHPPTRLSVQRPRSLTPPPPPRPSPGGEPPPAEARGAAEARVRCRRRACSRRRRSYPRSRRSRSPRSTASSRGGLARGEARGVGGGAGGEGGGGGAAREGGGRPEGGGGGGRAEGAARQRSAEGARRLRVEEEAVRAQGAPQRTTLAESPALSTKMRSAVRA